MVALDLGLPLELVLRQRLHPKAHRNISFQSSTIGQYSNLISSINTIDIADRYLHAVSQREQQNDSTLSASAHHLSFQMRFVKSAGAAQ